MPTNAPSGPERVYYFDNNATTRVAPEVLEAMLPFLGAHWGNPSSAYRFGQQVAQYLRHARERVAALLNADPKEIIFTSSGTESNNTALHSALATQPGKRHIVTTTVEHSAVLKYVKSVAAQGVLASHVPVASNGALDLAALEHAIRPDTAVVSVMWANNETGILFPVEEIAELCRTKGVLFHTDAVQAAGKVSLDVKSLGAQMVSLSGHKIHAPKGVGVLYVRRGTRFQPLLVGGQQENGRRGGTENVAAIVGLGRAAELSMARMSDENTRVRSLRDRLESDILSGIPKAERNGAAEPRLPNTSSIAFEAIEAEALLIQLDRVGICASSGSACTSGSLDPSPVIRAMGWSVARARGSIRFSLSTETTSEEVDYVLSQLPGMIKRLRALSE